jgi:predicted O-linked N-acetylglucosamine transferase (SPINDLY family)
MNKWLGRIFSRKKSVADIAATEPLVDPSAFTESVTQRRRGNEFLDRGDLPNAINCYRKAVASDPNSLDAHTSLGFALKELGELEAAQQVLDSAVQLKPDNFDAVYLLGQTFDELRRFEKAAEYFQKALDLRPAFERLYGELCHALFQIGELDRARELITNGIQLYPGNASFPLFLGNLYSFMEEWPQACSCYADALKVDPNLVQAHTNLATVFRAQGDLDSAAQHVQCALNTDPASPDAHAGQAANQDAKGDLKGALASFEKALDLDAKHVVSHRGKGNVLLKMGEREASIECFDMALTIEPDSAETHRDLGLVYLQLGKYREAEQYSRQALAIRPLYPSAQTNLGNALLAMGHFAEAEKYHLAALEIIPDCDVFLSNLGGSQWALGRLPEAIQSFRRATEVGSELSAGDGNLLYSNLLFGLSHSEEHDAQALFAEHCRFAEKFEAPLRSAWPAHANLRQPDRKLEIGFVSGDFRDHVVPQFVGPVLERLSKHPELSLHAYYNNAAEDSETRRLKGFFEHWHNVVGLPDAVVAKQIGDDHIDILIDLSGHTALNRLRTLAHKPAPVQVSWLGYPGTTGLQAVDYYLADQHVLPAGQFDDQFSECIVRLPALAPFHPSEVAPPVKALPALTNGFLTFGSFNRPSKINRTVVAWWAELLRALPNATMLIEGGPEDGQCMQWLAQEGIERARVHWHGRGGLKAYHDLHHQVDICLDTFPYNGATTSWSAVWMGVPTLALAGSTPAGRYGAAIMGQLGLNAFVANDQLDFVRKGVYWASHLDELADLRSGMRRRFGQSAAGQADLIASALANALRTMWQRWCKGLPAESFVAPAVVDNHAGMRPLSHS